MPDAVPIAGCRACRVSRVVRLACRVSRRGLRRFTAVQLGAVGGLYALKESTFGILFPLLIATLHPLRLLLGRSNLVSEEELQVLDPCAGAVSCAVEP